MNVAIEKTFTKMGDWPNDDTQFSLAMGYQPVITEVRPKDNIRYTVPGGDFTVKQPVDFLHGMDPVNYSGIVESATMNKLRGQLYPDGYPRGANPVDAVKAATSMSAKRDAANGGTDAKQSIKVKTQIKEIVDDRQNNYPTIVPTQIQQYDSAVGRPTVFSPPLSMNAIPIEEMPANPPVVAPSRVEGSFSSFAAAARKMLRKSGITSITPEEMQGLAKSYVLARDVVFVGEQGDDEKFQSVERIQHAEKRGFMGAVSDFVASLSEPQQIDET